MLWDKLYYEKRDEVNVVVVKVGKHYRTFAAVIISGFAYSVSLHFHIIHKHFYIYNN